MQQASGTLHNVLATGQFSEHDMRVLTSDIYFQPINDPDALFFAEARNRLAGVIKPKEDAGANGWRSDVP